MDARLLATLLGLDQVSSGLIIANDLVLLLFTLLTNQHAFGGMHPSLHFVTSCV